jgi:hypothetical protein
MTNKEYFNRYFWPALWATKSPKKALYALAQSAYETGKMADSSVAAKTNNMFGITQGSGSPLASGTYTTSDGRTFRKYTSPAKSFKDWVRLMGDHYNQYYQADTASGFAQIAYSPYIVDSDRRPRYRKGLLSYYEDFHKILQTKLLKYGALIAAGIVLYFLAIKQTVKIGLLASVITILILLK